MDKVRCLAVLLVGVLTERRDRVIRNICLGLIFAGVTASPCLAQLEPPQPEPPELSEPDPNLPGELEIELPPSPGDGSDSAGKRGKIELRPDPARELFVDPKIGKGPISLGPPIYRRLPEGGPGFSAEEWWGGRPDFIPVEPPKPGLWDALPKESEGFIERMGRSLRGPVDTIMEGVPVGPIRLRPYVGTGESGPAAGVSVGSGAIEK